MKCVEVPKFAVSVAQPVIRHGIFGVDFKGFFVALNGEAEIFRAVEIVALFDELAVFETLFVNFQLGANFFLSAFVLSGVVLIFKLGEFGIDAAELVFEFSLTAGGFG